MNKYIWENDLIFLWSWADSKVFRIGNTDKVLKIYPTLSPIQIKTYHEIHHKASINIPLAWIRLPWNFSLNSIGQAKYAQVRVLDLLNAPIITVSRNDFSRNQVRNQRGARLSIDPLPDKWNATIVPYIWWEELYSYSTTPQWKYLLDLCSWELEEYWVPVVGTHEFEQLHPINIKFFPPFWETISLVITDIGASIEWTLAAHRVFTQSPPSASNHPQDPLSP